MIMSLQIGVGWHLLPAACHLPHDVTGFHFQAKGPYMGKLIE